MDYHQSMTARIKNFICTPSIGQKQGNVYSHFYVYKTFVVYAPRFYEILRNGARPDLFGNLAVSVSGLFLNSLQCQQRESNLHTHVNTTLKALQPLKIASKLQKPNVSVYNVIVATIRSNCRTAARARLRVGSIYNPPLSILPAALLA